MKRSETCSGESWVRRALVAALLAAIVCGAVAASIAADQSIRMRVGKWGTGSLQTFTPNDWARFIAPGYDIELFPFNNPADQKTALLAKSLDLCGTSISQAIISASRGEPVVYVAALCEKCSAIVVRVDGDIKKPADLKGKRIGYVPNTIHEVLIRETLTREGLDPAKDATLMRVDGETMNESLWRGDIDAYCYGEPRPRIAMERGYGRVLAYPYYGESIGTINAGILTTREMVEKRRDLVQAAVTAHARATEYLMSHRDEWTSATAGLGVRNVEMLRRSLESGNVELSWRIDDAYIARAKALGERMEALKMIAKQPDYDTLFDLSFVKEAERQIAAEKKDAK